MIVDGDFNLLLIVSNLLLPDRLKNPVFELGRDGESSNGPNKPPDNVLKRDEKEKNRVKKLISAKMKEKFNSANNYQKEKKGVRLSMT